ncbi:Phenylalanine/tyrosine ammonia-lyase-like protein [Hapsidospora chrysogenum ATCC 11550]|uniref:Phenylalanine/tyrosine ammonia-lyase-like protein n=1 Tax=Hapsidospora chrysogenum (strain ATCC 11550 / CBS 779.69 / DSM 880 / IAM 14645 / JCM 23072 / IMI 49137) TaxID=857340 RepID=A0A086SVQ5_HAPC1|nr:Phenylalanine/tyrosine ammonia-lyase-like protein [Hapsidospora chrysogenum ATCC 11550]
MMGAKVAEHTSATLRLWTQLQDLRRGRSSIVLDGDNLSIAALVAVARHSVRATISTDDELARRIERSIVALDAYLSKDRVVYGVNTGFGGSADARTQELDDLQIGLLQHTQSAILTSWDKELAARAHEREPAHVMNPEWVKAAMVTRANQNLRGHSAVRLEVLQRLVAMAELDIVPMVPLRGSISASGDLMPMSYIAGALTGNPDVFVQVGKGKAARVVPSCEALRENGLTLTALAPKEGLGLINGTAPSVSVGSLVLYDAQQLAYLSQICTAFTSECLGGNVEWAAPFVHAIRPHPGQIEVASNIRRALHGSKFVVGLESRKRTGDGLWQDRYSTRTAPQWVGPYLEDLLLAQRQLETELNSTSDNPIVDANEMPGGGVPSGEVYSGGNFQAVAVTSAMDKTRLALQMIGRMLFSQVTEMIHPSTNHGLEANLNASDRENFTMKGIDVNMAAYMSELAALAHPVSAHVMSAEMHNQGINSLALLSARRTMEAVDLVRHMCACHLYVACQAIDLRATQRLFLETMRNKVLLDETDKGAFHGLGLSGDELAQMTEKTFPVIESTWCHWNLGSWKERIPQVVEAVMSPVTQFLAATKPEVSVAQLDAFRSHFSDTISAAADAIFYPNLAITPAAVATQLGDGTAPLYAWVRSRLGVPTHCGLDDDPLYNLRRGLPTEGKKTIGSWVGMVYESLRGEMMDVIMQGAGDTKAAPRTQEEFEALCAELKKPHGVNGHAGTNGRYDLGRTTNGVLN